MPLIRAAQEERNAPDQIAEPLLVVLEQTVRSQPVTRLGGELRRFQRRFVQKEARRAGDRIHVHCAFLVRGIADAASAA